VLFSQFATLRFAVPNQDDRNEKPETRKEGNTMKQHPSIQTQWREKIHLNPLPKLHTLPATLPVEGAVRIELEEGVPIFKASKRVQERIEALLAKNREIGLAAREEEELDLYEEIDDYFSFLNRTVRNLIQAQSKES
jgi:hypothetical protein